MSVNPKDSMKLNHPKETKESEHGPPLSDPDPTFVTIVPASEADRIAVGANVKQLDDKDIEIQRLRRELQLSQGKIKGFQTLVHLFQESKQECSRYKQMNEQLSLKLDNLLRLPPFSRLSENFNSTSVFNTALPCDLSIINDSGQSEACSTGEITKVSSNEVQAETSTEMSTLVENDAKVLESSDMKANFVGHVLENVSGQFVLGHQYGSILPNRSSNSSPLSSQSFVQINNSGQSNIQSPVIDQPVKHVEQEKSSGSKDNFATQLSHINDCLADKQQSKDLLSDLFKISTKIMKLEKHCCQQQVLMDQLNLQICSMQQENDELKTKLIQAQQHVSGSAHVSTGSVTKSMEWVDVQNKDTLSSSLKESAVTAESVELRNNRIEVVQLRKQIQEINAASMLSVEQLKLQISILEEEKKQLLHKFDIAQHAHDKDKIALNAEIKKCTLLLEQEKQKCMEAEERIAEQTKRITQLQHDITAISNSQLEPVDTYFLTLEQNNRAVNSASESSLMSESDLRNQLLLLRQQVTIFKEDFDQERRDREKAKNEAEDYKKKIGLLNMKIISITEQLEKGRASFTRAQKENDVLKEHLNKISKEIKSLKNQANSPDNRLYSSNYVAGPVFLTQQSQQLIQQQQQLLQQQLPPLVHRHQSYTVAHKHTLQSGVSRQNTAERFWPCARCTFENAESSIACEVCGQHKPGFDPMTLHSNTWPVQTSNQP